MTQAASWTFPFEMAVEITRVVISDVVTPADVVTLQSGSPREARRVRNKIAMVQRLLKTGGVPAGFGRSGLLHQSTTNGCTCSDSGGGAEMILTGIRLLGVMTLTM